MTETEIKQYIISNPICTANELMSECALTFDKLASAAQNDIAQYKALAEECGITEFRRPLIWSEIIPLCHDEITLHRIELLVWLMSGGSFETRDKELVAEQWIYTTQTSAEIFNWLQERKRKKHEFSDIMHELHLGKKKSEKKGESYLKIYRMLCLNYPYESNADREILRDNLSYISDFISEHCYLKPIEPLIFFKVLVRHRKRMMNHAGFLPDIIKALERTEYEQSGENDKLFKRNMEHCQLYVDIKECCNGADASLCDIGFIGLTNLAEWAYRYLEPCDELPVTTLEAANWCKGCMRSDCEGLSPWGMAETAVEELELKREYSRLAKTTADAANKIVFNDLAEFCQAPEKLFGKLMLNKISHTDIQNARLLFLEAAAKRFECLIIDEICTIFDEYTTCSA